MSGGPVRAIVVVVVVAGHATSHTLNTYMNTQQLPPSTLLLPLQLLWLSTAHYGTTPSTIIAVTTPTSTTTDCRGDDSVAIAGVCGGQLLLRISVVGRQNFLTFRPRRQAIQHCRGVSVGWPARYGSGPLFVCLSIISSFINDCDCDGGGGGRWRVLCVRTHSGKPRTSGVRRSQFAAVPLSPGRSDSRISRSGIAATGQWARCAR